MSCNFGCCYNWLKLYPRDIMDGVYSTKLHGMVRRELTTCYSWLRMSDYNFNLLHMSICHKCVGMF